MTKLISITSSSPNYVLTLTSKLRGESLNAYYISLTIMLGDLVTASTLDNCYRGYILWTRCVYILRL